mgnify:CR=1 FL=1
MQPLSNPTLWSAYFAIQALACTLWWALILTDPGVAAGFAASAKPQDVSMLQSFWLADMVCVIGGSALCALMLYTGSALRTQALWWTAGSISFATLYCLVIWMENPQSVWACALMVPATLLTLTGAQVLSPAHEAP